MNLFLPLRICVSLSLICASVAAHAAPAVKNFREIYESLLLATNTFPSASINAAYTSTRTRLPIAGEFTELSSTTITALGALSGVVCREFLTNEENKNPAQRLVHKNVDFTKAPAQISAEVMADVHAQYADLLWGRAITAAEQAQFQAMFMHAASIADAKTKDAFFSTCVTAATSLDFLMVR